MKEKVAYLLIHKSSSLLAKTVVYLWRMFIEDSINQWSQNGKHLKLNLNLLYKWKINGNWFLR